MTTVCAMLPTLRNLDSIASKMSYSTKKKNHVHADKKYSLALLEMQGKKTMKYKDNMYISISYKKNYLRFRKPTNVALHCPPEARYNYYTSDYFIYDGKKNNFVTYDLMIKFEASFDT